MAAHSSIFAQRIPWTEEPGGLQSMGRKKLDTTERLILNTRKKLGEKRSARKEVICQTRTFGRFTSVVLPYVLSYTLTTRETGEKGKIFFLSRQHVSVISASPRQGREVYLSCSKWSGQDHHSSVQLLSHIRLFVTPWTAAHQTSLSYYLGKIFSGLSTMQVFHFEKSPFHK